MKLVYAALVAVVVGALLWLSAPAKGADPKPGSCANCPCEDCKCEKGKPCPVFLAMAQKLKVGEEAEKVEELVFSDGKVLSINKKEVSPNAAFFINGKEVTSAEFIEWSGKHVDVKVVNKWGVVEYFGGKSFTPSVAAVAPTLGGCANGSCGVPQRVVPAPQWSFPSGGCPNGRCGIPGVPTIK